MEMPIGAPSRRPGRLRRRLWRPIFPQDQFRSNCLLTLDSRLSETLIQRARQRNMDTRDMKLATSDGGTYSTRWDSFPPDGSLTLRAPNPTGRRNLGPNTEQTLLETGKRLPRGEKRFPSANSSLPKAGSHFLAPGCRFPVEGSDFPEAGIHCLGPGNGFPEAGTRFLVRGSDFPTQGSRCPAGGSHFPASGSPSPGLERTSPHRAGRSPRAET